MNAVQLPLDFQHRIEQTFENFLPGNNREIVEHLQQCLYQQTANFIFLWGEAGLGKTHLLQACGHLAQQQQMDSFYLDLAHNDPINPSMLSGLETYPLVCVDNIEHLAGDPDWELAFFNFFNQHRDSGHRLIVSSSISAKTIAIELPDLKTRLNWGLTLKLQPLTEEEHTDLLIQKSKQMGILLPPESARFLLSRYRRDWFSLWHLLVNLDKVSLTEKRKLTLPFLRKILLKSNRP